MTTASESEPGGRSPRGGFFLNVVPALLYVAAVFYGGGLGESVVRGPDFRFGDKILHAAAFAGMVFVIRRALSWLSPDWPAAHVVILASLTSAALGGVLELYQSALPHRSAEWLDFLADVVGAAAAAALIWWQIRAQRKLTPS